MDVRATRESQAEEALRATLAEVRAARLSEAAAARARKRWDSIAKPLNSLGALEDAVVQIAALTGDAHVDISKRCVVVLCADNGVVCEGVSQSGQDVTATVALNVARGVSSVCRMCEPIGVECLAVDMGMAAHPLEEGLIDRRIAAGTGNIAVGPAMTRAQAAEAVMVGVDLVADLAKQGYGLIAAGEVGIGNTTTSAAMVCAFTGLPPVLVAGRGAGLSSSGLARKVSAIERALVVNAPHADDALDVLAKLGGFDIAGMCGLYLGGAVHRIPIIMDGFMSLVAAYCAFELEPACRGAVLASHLSAEPAAAVLLKRMNMHAIIHAHMHLGEGTGAVCLVPLLDMAVNLYEHGTTFDGCGIDPYQVLT